MRLGKRRIVVSLQGQHIIHVQRGREDPFFPYHFRKGKDSGTQEA